MIGIYKLTSPTGKVYIGQSWDISKRMSKYKSTHCEDQLKLYNSIKKYGFGNHEFKIVHQLPVDIDQNILDYYEQLYMDAYRDCGIELMNIRDGGSRGKHSEETIKKMRGNNGKWMLGRKLSKETKIKIGKASIGNKHNLGRSPSEETRHKISVFNKGRASPFKGGSHSEQHKKDLANRMRGNKYNQGVKWTPEQREKMMASRVVPWNKGLKGVQKFSEESKRRRSERMSGDKHPKAKVTDAQVIGMRERFNSGDTAKEIAMDFNINYSHCVKIVTNKTRKSCVPS